MEGQAPNGKRCQCLADPLGRPYEKGIGLCSRRMTAEDLLCDLCRAADHCAIRPGPASGYKYLMHSRWFTSAQLRDYYAAGQDMNADVTEMHTWVPG